MIRVAHLHSSLGVYGAELWTDTLVQHLDNTKVASVVVTVDDKPGSTDFHTYLLSKGVQAVHFPIRGRVNPRLIYRLHKFLVNQKIDVLHTHGFKADILGYLARLGLDTKLISTPHGWSADESKLIALYERIDRFFLQRFDAIYALSPAMTGNLQSFHPNPERVHLVLNAVDINRLQDCYETRTKQTSQNIEILFVGRLCEPKGVFELMKAFSIMKRPTGTRLRFVGEGPARIALQALADELGLKDAVVFEGYVSDTRPFLRDATVLALPSYSEGIPRTIMEAFAVGLPVVGSKIPGIQQLITQNETGLLVEPKSIDELSRAITRLCMDFELRERLSHNARQKIVNEYSGERLARDFETHYGDLCANGTGILVKTQ